MTEEIMIAGEPVAINNMHDNSEFLPKENSLTEKEIEKVAPDASFDTAALDMITEQFSGQVTEMPAVDNSLFGSLAGYEPQPVEEKEFGPKILQGKYNAVINRFQRSTGTWPSGDAYDKYQVSIQITDTVDAKTDGTNMYVNRDYNLLDTDWKTGQQSIEDMLNELNQFVAEVTVQGSTADEIFESIDVAVSNLIGEPVTCRVWPQKYKKDWQDKKAGEYKKDKKGYVKHSFAFASRVDLNADTIT